MISEFRNRSLKKLIESAKAEVLKNGRKRATQKGVTYSLSGVKFTWKNPLEDDYSYFYWDKKSDDWYQKVFVEKSEGNRPEHLAKKGALLFPYIYAARSRFYDGGLGYVMGLTKVTKIYGKSFVSILKSEESFINYLSFAGEFIHLQNVLAVLNWVGRDVLEGYQANPDFPEKLLSLSRSDNLLRLIQEVKSEPGSRRLVTPSFVYSKIDQGLDAILGIPPYQFFQVLPGESSQPVSSLHFHRSLDAGGGVQLDFHHDFSWLKLISQITKRRIGDITVMAGDFHVYVRENRSSEHLSGKTNIKDWLKAVTGGYISGFGAPRKLLEKEEFYSHNARKVYRYLLK